MLQQKINEELLKKLDSWKEQLEFQTAMKKAAVPYNTKPITQCNKKELTIRSGRDKRIVKINRRIKNYKKLLNIE